MATPRKMKPMRGSMAMPDAKFSPKTLKRILSYMKRYTLKYIIVFICVIISTSVSVKSQTFIENLIDDYITPLIGNPSPVFNDLLKFLGFMCIFYLVGVASSFAFNRIMIYVGQGILKDIRNDMFNHMETLPISYFDKNSNGDIMSRYTNDIDTLRQMISQSLINFIQNILSIILIFIAMCKINIKLSFIVLVGIILMIALIGRILKAASGYFKAQQESLGAVDGYIEEMISGQKVIKVFTHEEKTKEEFDALNEELCRNATKASSLGNIVGPLTGNIGNILYVIIAFLGGSLAIEKGLFSIGQIATFLILTKNFTHPIMQITSQFNSIILAFSGAERIFELIDEKEEENKGEVNLVFAKKVSEDEYIETSEYTGTWGWKKDKEIIPLKGDVRLKDVYFGYVKEKEVLHDISLFAKPGQKIAFVGSTGAGKTTITNLLNRFYDIEKGTITYDGIDIKEINKKDLRKSLGIVLQDTNLFTGTIMDNIRYGKEDATDEECIEAAKLANAHDFIEMLPEGYDTVITGNGSELSQGQRQLLSIARCAVANPPAMILDEATSSIDTRTEKIIQDGMDALMKDRTVFVIAHRLSTVQNSKAIMVLENGKIIERGDHDDLIAQKGKYYELYTGAFELE